ncbi:MAG: tetratricopeptide (TPR) repeat protein [Patiriisocius sp.]|jgi:tetratricopeptide (TPR) repeat protein
MRVLIPFLLAFALVSCAEKSSDVSHLDIENIEKSLFKNPNSISDSLKLVAFEAYNEFSTKHPKDEMSPEYLFRAANISRSFKKYDEAIRIYQRIVDLYPAYNMVTESHFLIAFVYDSDLNDKEKASAIYEQVAKKYPNEKFGKEAAMRLETIHLTDEELMDMFRKKNPELKMKKDSTSNS